MSSTRPLVKLSCMTGLSSAKYVQNIKDLQLAFNLTGNTGNMIHAEAPLKFLEYNFSRSAISDVHKLFNTYENKSSFFEDINNNFDCIVLSLANLIRPDFNTNLHEILEGLGVPFYVLGVGLQNEVSLTSLRTNTQKLLHVLNNKAKLFGVRGLRTETWLHNNGFKNAIALGCPSLYVYPDTIMKKKVVAQKYSSVITAGHLSDYYVSKKNDKRVEVILKILGSFDKTSYVFQDEPFTFKEFLDAPGIWQENLSRFDSRALNSYLSIRLDQSVNFFNYYMFFCTDTWRATCSNYDLYLGDRLHAGIAAHQAGIPSVIIYHDMRVKELADFYNFPSLSVDAIIDNNIQDLLPEVLSESSTDNFRATYLNKYNFFVSKLESTGLKIKYKHSSTELEGYSKISSLPHKTDSIINKAQYLRQKIKSDGTDILYAKALKMNNDIEECWSFLTQQSTNFDERSPLFKLFVIEEAIYLGKEFPIDDVLSGIAKMKLNRAEHRKISEILSNIEELNLISYDTIIAILKQEHSDSFDECVKFLVKLDYESQAIEYLNTKIVDGYGTRARVNLILTLLIRNDDFKVAQNILLEYSHYLSEALIDKFDKKVK